MLYDSPQELLERATKAESELERIKIETKEQIEELIN